MSTAPIRSTVLETRHLRLVQAIAEAGSVTLAGERLHLTQSAVSRQLGELEDRLGVRLFSRVRKRLAITPAGMHLLDESRRILDDLARTERELKLRAAPSVRWPLRISTECYTCYHWLPPALRDFERRHPDADLRIVLDATRDPLPALLRGELELAIASSPVKRRELEVEPLFSDEVVAIFAPNHPFAERRWIEGADLAGETLLTFDVGSADAAWFRRAVLGRVVPRAIRQVPITEVMIELVRAELGVGVVHRWVAEPHVRSGALHACRLTRGGLWKTWQAVFARRTERRAALVDLAAAIRRGSRPATGDGRARSTRAAARRKALSSPL